MSSAYQPQRAAQAAGRMIALAVIALVALDCCGCEAFVRKFRRTQAKPAVPDEEVVYAPQEYPPGGADARQLYQQFFSYWEGWQDELADALVNDTNKKRQLDCAREAVKNLREMARLLEPELKQRLQQEIDAMAALQEQIAGDIYNLNAASHRARAEKLRRHIHNAFRPSRIEGGL